MVQFTRRQELLPFLICFALFLFVLADVLSLEQQWLNAANFDLQPCMLALLCATVTQQNQQTINENNHKQGQRANKTFLCIKLIVSNSF